MRFTQEERCILRMYGKRDRVHAAEAVLEALDSTEGRAEREILASVLDKLSKTDEADYLEALSAPCMIPEDE